MNTRSHLFGRHPLTRVVPLSLLLVAGIGLVDYFTGYEISFSTFYLIPVSLAVWFGNRVLGLVISVLCVAAWLAGDLAAGVSYSSSLVPVWNASLTLAFYLIVMLILAKLRHLNLELEARVHQRTDQLTKEIQERARLEKELVELGEQSQREIGHDLHDTLGQHLTAAAFAGQVLIGQLEHKSPSEAAAVKNLVKLIEESIGLTRQFARGLQPVELEPEGLMGGFQELARNISERFQLTCEFECPEPVLLHDAASSTHLYRIAQEAVTNAIKHGGAKFINLSLEKNAEATTLTITDDGTGLPPVPASGGMGLRIMAYRASVIGAAFHIERLPESGTRVTVRLPAAPANHHAATD
jgi:signal transduction histidine kinase